MKTYDQAPPEVHERVQALVRKFHPDLDKVGLRVDILMASTDSEDGHAVTHGGYPALAVVRIVGPKERAKDAGDAEIVIDRDAYEAMDPAARDALLDHELYHLNLQLDKKSRPKLDDHRRPKLKMRKHDVQVGWFHEIARRHGQQSHEVRQATEIYEEAGQLYFGFAGKAGAGPAVESAAANFVTSTQGMISKGDLNSVTISTPGGPSVTIDKDGVHSDPTEDQIAEATKMAKTTGWISRSALQRALRVSYNLACKIVDRLVADKVVGPADNVGRFELLPAAQAA